MQALLQLITTSAYSRGRLPSHQARLLAWPQYAGLIMTLRTRKEYLDWMVHPLMFAGNVHSAVWLEISGVTQDSGRNMIVDGEPSVPNIGSPTFPRYRVPEGFKGSCRGSSSM